MTVTLPDELRAGLEEAAGRERVGSVDEFVRLLCLRALDRADAVAEEDQRRLTALVQEGLASGPAVEVGEQFWAELRRAAEQKAAVGGGVG
jgi:antitoxin ParD1/3/4